MTRVPPLIERPPVGAGLVVAAALLVAAVIGLVTLPAKGGAATEQRPTAVQAPLPARESGGRVLTYFADAGFSGVVADVADPSVLQVVIPRGRAVTDCNVIRPRLTVRSQDTETVRLVVSGYQYVPRAASTLGGTTCVSAGSAVLTLRLLDPLGTRQVFDGNSPRATVVADPADFPRLQPVPRGYRLVGSAPVSATAGRLVASRTYRGGGNGLVLRIGDQYSVSPPGIVSGTVSLHGDLAQASSSGATRCLTWYELSGRVRQLCATVKPVLSAPALAALAATVR